jgi:hypothetical protein
MMKTPRLTRSHAFVALAMILIIAGCGRQSTPQPTAPAAIAIAEPDADGAARGRIPFSAAEIYLEYNATANDAGIQVFLDAEDWKRVTIHGEHGRALVDISAGGGMRELGLTELRFEGAEPGPSEVFETFAPGEYTFSGVTIDQQGLFGSAFLSHDIPAAPNFSPSSGEVVDRNSVVIQWDAIGGLDRYQVIVESDANDLSLEVSVSAATTSLTVPPSFLAPNTVYKAEVLAIAASGNRTISEGTFVTGP